MHGLLEEGGAHLRLRVRPQRPPLLLRGRRHAENRRRRTGGVQREADVGRHGSGRVLRVIVITAAAGLAATVYWVIAMAAILLLVAFALSFLFAADVVQRRVLRQVDVVRTSCGHSGGI